MRTVTSTLFILLSLACLSNGGPVTENDYEDVRGFKHKDLCRICIPGRGIRVRTFLEKLCAKNHRIVKCIKRAVFPKQYKVKIEAGLRCSCKSNPRSKPKRRPRRVHKPRPTSFVPNPPSVEEPEIPEDPDKHRPPHFVPNPPTVEEPKIPEFVPHPPIQARPSTSPFPSRLPKKTAPPSRPTPEQVECDTMRRSGGPGKTMLEVNLGKTSGKFSVTYMMFSIPDELEVFYEGELIFTTSGPVRGTDTVEIDFNGSESTVLIVVSAPNTSTVWRLLIGCP